MVYIIKYVLLHLPGKLCNRLEEAAMPNYGSTDNGYLIVEALV